MMDDDGRRNQIVFFEHAHPKNNKLCFVLLTRDDMRHEWFDETKSSDDNEKFQENGTRISKVNDLCVKIFLILAWTHGNLFPEVHYCRCKSGAQQKLHGRHDNH